MAKISILVFLGVLVSIVFIVNDSSVIGANQHLSKGKAYLAYPDIINGVQNTVQLGCDGFMSPIVSMAIAIGQSNMQLKTFNLPLDSADYIRDFDYSSVINLMNAYGEQEETMMQGVGVISVEEAGTPEANFSNKISAEIARDTFNVGCVDYVYAATDISTDFYGYCAFKNDSVDFNHTVYSSVDYGLTVSEISLFTNSQLKAAFLPVFILLGQPSFSYERSHWNGGSSAYAITFAQKNLYQITNMLTKLTIGRTGVTYILEKSTGFLIATSSAESVVNSIGARVLAVDAQTRLIRESAQYLVSRAPFSSYTTNSYFDPRFDKTNGLLIDIRPYEYAPSDANLDWAIVVTIPASDYTAWVSGNTHMSIVVAVVVGLVLLLILLGLVYFVIARPIVNSNIPTRISEIQKGRDNLLSR